MKVLISIISSVLILFSISSCTQPAGPSGPTGNTGPVGSSDYIVSNYTVNPTSGTSGWNTTDSNNAALTANQSACYNHTFTGFSIQPTVNGEFPIVEVYYSTSTGSGAIYYPLPGAVWGNDWLSYNYTTTKVNLIYNNPTYYSSGPLPLPQTLYIKIVIIPSP